MRWGMLLAIASVAGLAATAQSPEPLRVPGPKKKPPKTGDGPQVDTLKEVLDEGSALIRYQGGDRIPLEADKLPKIKMGKGLVGYVTGVVDKFLEIVGAAAGGGGSLYPTAWTEEDPQIDELTAIVTDVGAAISVRVVATVESAWNDDPGTEWYPCREITWQADQANATRILYAIEDRSLVPSPQPGKKWLGLVPCQYAARQYDLASEVTPRPEPPDWSIAIGVEPYAKDRQRIAIYLYTPPRLGQIRTVVDWVIRSAD